MLDGRSLGRFRGAARVLVIGAGLFALACSAPARGLQSDQVQLAEPGERSERRAAAEAVVSRRPDDHVTTVKLHQPLPAGTDARNAALLFRRRMQASIGETSAHCGCPDLSPSGRVVAADVLGDEALRSSGAGVEYSADVRMVCVCPGVDLSREVSFPGYVQGLRRLRRECSAARRESCRPFEAHLARFEELCTTRFSGEPMCRERARALRSAGTADVIRVSQGEPGWVVSYNMPCSPAHLPDCERCIEFQMLASNNAESVANDRCRAAGFPALVYYRALRCRQTQHGPDPVYEAGCREETGAAVPSGGTRGAPAREEDRGAEDGGAAGETDPSERREGAGRREPGLEPPPTECCFAHEELLDARQPEYEGRCCVTPASDETCRSILSYLNTPTSAGKAYCQSTSVRGRWFPILTR